MIDKWIDASEGRLSDDRITAGYGTPLEQERFDNISLFTNAKNRYDLAPVFDSNGSNFGEG